MTEPSEYQQQHRLSSFDESSPVTTPGSFSEPPIPAEQDDLELLTPQATVEVLQDPTSDVRKWLAYVRDSYTPPDKRVLLLYPCASTKPMPDSPTYRALEETLRQFPPQQRHAIHVVTVSEPMAIVPYEFQDGATWTYDNPGLFEWHVKEHDRSWDSRSQQQALEILGEHIAGFLKRSMEQEWYDTHIACVRHVSAEGNPSSDQTHRRMLSIAEEQSGCSLEWLPNVDTVTSLSEANGRMAWQMRGVAHQVIQAELADTLRAALSDT